MIARFRLDLAALSFVLAMGATGSAQAFGAIDGFGMHAEHRRITLWALAREGISPGTLNQLAGSGGLSFGAVGAPDNPIRGLLDYKPAHCDGGDYFDEPGYPQSAAAAEANLQACRAWMDRNLKAAVNDAAGLTRETAGALARPPPQPLHCHFDGRRTGSAKCLVLGDLGLMLHASQDFYAHSNWVDRPSPDSAVSVNNPPGLGNAGPAPWLAPGSTATFPKGLITGCYDGFPEIFHCGFFGEHRRVAHRVLNKDTGPIDPVARTVGSGTTPRGRVQQNFQRAVRAAVDDTRLRWAAFERRLSARYGVARAAVMLCILKSDAAGACTR